MKTSNKILLGFLIVVFLVPVYVLVSFKSKIKKGQFNVVKNELSISDDHHNGFFKPYKVIKIASSGGRTFKCDLQYSDSAFYSYNNDSLGDSIRISYKADTVFVEYVNFNNDKENPGQFRNEAYANIKIPSLSNVVVENAEINIKSADYGIIPVLHAEVSGSGVIKIGTIEEDSTTSKSSSGFGEIYLQSDNGTIIFGKSVQIAQLNFSINGSTSITIEEGATIGEMKGNLSDSSSINASWKYLKRLLPLTK